ncbi:MAG: tripartite tricarboxylate transporter substrate-binding protein [Pseudomonadota bacterium]
MQLPSYAQYAKSGDGFPKRALTMIVPYGPGGGSGQFAGGIAQAFTELTGVAVNRDHKPGGSGSVGSIAYMATPKDGYTILEHIDDSASAHVVDASLPHPTEDWIPLMTGQVTFSQIFIRSNETRFTDWDSFIAYARDAGGKATIANVSREGSMERLNMHFITEHYGVQVQQISFDKGGPRYAALKGGQVDALFEQPGDVRNFLDSGDFKPILTLLHDRPAAFADTPSLSDVGLTFEPLMRYRGVYVHKDIPAERLKWLQDSWQKSFNQASFQEFNKKKFMDLIPSFRDTPGSIELINSTMAIYDKTLRDLGIIK